MAASVISPEFLALFVPATILVYALVPQRARWGVLLAASGAFFWFVSTKLVVFAVASTLSVYAAARGIDALGAARDAAIAANKKDRKAIKARFSRRQDLVMAAALALNLGMLAAFKYLVFFGQVATSLARLAGLGMTFAPPRLAAPIGVSFYTLSAIAYLVDVRRGGAEAERNYGHVALCLCFFPIVVEGPIVRLKEVKDRLVAGAPVTAANLYAGALRIAWGVAKKVVVADRVNVFVKAVFDNGGASYDGGIIALAAVLYVVQLYCDFSGAIDVALGIGRIFDVRLPENFSRPFFSKSASEFWQRWHVTLGAWLRDYIYYPVTLSKPVKRLTKAARKRLGNRLGPVVASSIALFLVWLANGLWHGAGSQYILFGMYYFVLIVAGELAQVWAARHPRVEALRASAGWRAFQHLRTLLIVVVGELIFRAPGVRMGLAMLGRLWPANAAYGSTPGGVLGVTTGGMRMDVCDFALVAAFVLALLVVSLLQERGRDPLERAGSLGLAPRLALLFALVFVSVVFGAYGHGYTPVDPIYAQF